MLKFFNANKIWMFLLLFGLPIAVVVILNSLPKHTIFLPKLGHRSLDSVMVDGKMVMDTVYHSIPDFSFIDQRGEIVTNDSLEGKIYVADFFFTNCEGICPIMTSQLQRVQIVFEFDDDIRLVSYSVDPERDSVEALAAFAESYNAIPGKWFFLTGDKKKLHALAEEGYLTTAKDGSEPGVFDHAPNLLLIDKERLIRGTYDGTNTESVTTLIEDIRRLKSEYAIKRDMRSEKR